MALSMTEALAPRQQQNTPSSTDITLNLLSDPFSSQLSDKSLLASVFTSLGVTLIIGVLFCFLRPFNSVVYAPRLKHADERHAPPAIGKGPLAWISPVIKTKEQALVEKVGLDAAVFMRFTRMCRNIFLTLTVVGCGILIPVSVMGNEKWLSQFKDASSLTYVNPINLPAQWYWAYVCIAYGFTLVVCGFLWWNYRAVLRLRKGYFASPEYQTSLHARTLMITDIPKEFRTDEGLIRIADEVKQTEHAARASIGRNVKDLPDMIEEHEKAVRALEGYLAKYLRNPDKLPPNRPMCKPSKKDHKHAHKEKVDAIDYLTTRIKVLEMEIREVRESVDKRNAMQYGFVSYETIEDAHQVAYAGHRRAPHGTSVRLAPRPNDLIWKNLARSKKDRKWARTVNHFYVAILTVVWIIPNALIAVFLSNLSNLGTIWPAFRNELALHHTSWAVVQGVLAPAILSLFYFLLPSIFRRMSIRAGDLSKTSRERHVTHSLFAFFVFNNLVVFSLFSTFFHIISKIVAFKRDGNTEALNDLKTEALARSLVTALTKVSPFWITWLLQRNLGAAIDLAQLFNLAWGSISRKFFSPTPRELIEWSAPPPFDYASYYNYFLFYMTVALCFAPLQPIVLPVAALYFLIDSYLKKYLILYVFITKTESGGQFWRVLFNRCLVAVLLANIFIALPIAVFGADHMMLYCMVPLPFLLLGFKFYCSRSFDRDIKYVSKGSRRKNPEAGLPDKSSRKIDRVGVRFGHPALYKPLLTPMVHAKSQHVLKEVYRGRLEDDFEAATIAGYSDTYGMHKMERGQPGKTAGGPAPFEIVPEGKLDFENFKNRADFAYEHGGNGELFDRPGTPSTIATFGRHGHDRGRSSSRGSLRSDIDDTAGTTYPTGYHQTPSGAFRGESPAGTSRNASPAGTRSDQRGLLNSAAPMAVATPGYSNVPNYNQAPDYNQHPPEMNYDYFRGRR